MTTERYVIYCPDIGKRKGALPKNGVFQMREPPPAGWEGRFNTIQCAVTLAKKYFSLEAAQQGVKELLLEREDMTYAILKIIHESIDPNYHECRISLAKNEVALRMRLLDYELDTKHKRVEE